MKLVSKAITLIIIVGLFSCQQIKNVTHTLSSFSSLRFKIENVSEFYLAGVPLQNKSTITDITSMEAIKIGQEITKNRLPAKFIVNIAVKNPNTGIGGSKPIPVSIKQMDWVLYIDGVQTISGKLNKVFHFPADNTIGHLPLEVNIDLFEFFGNRGYEGIVNLALYLGGVRSDPSKIAIEAVPTFSTPFGDYQSPKIRITSDEFN
jgi:LEA14-like dessication related protein